MKLTGLFKRLSLIFQVQLLFLIDSIFIVTIGPALSAMLYSFMKLHEGDEAVVANYKKSFRQNLKQGIVLWIFYVVLIALVSAVMLSTLGISFGILPDLSSFRILAYILAIPTAMSFYYSFALLARFDNSLKATVINAFLLSFMHLNYTVAVIMLTVVFIFVNMLGPVAILVSALFLFEILMFVVAGFMSAMTKNYMEGTKENQANKRAVAYSTRKKEIKAYQKQRIKELTSQGIPMDQAFNIIKNETNAMLEEKAEEAADSTESNMDTTKGDIDNGQD